jgi:hypothetical protein
MGFTESLLCISLLNLSQALERTAVLAHIINLLPIKYLKVEKEVSERQEFMKKLHAK